MTDLFKNKSEQLLDFIRAKRWVKTHEICQWGVSHFCNEPTRLARKLAQEKKIRRLERHEKLMSFGKSREGIWTIV